MLTINGDDEVTDKVRHIFLRFRSIYCISPGSRDFNFCKAGNAHIDSFVVLIYDFLTALLEVGIIIPSLHGSDSFVDRNNVRKFKESSLENGVYTVAEADFASQFRSINDVELGMFVIEVFLHLSRKFFVQFFDTPRAVEEVYAAIFQICRRIVFLDICRSMTADEVSGAYEICCMDWFVTEAEVGLCQTTSLHGVIGKVCLCVFISIETDNSDGVLVGTNGTIAATAPDFCRNLARIIDVEFFRRQ